MPPQSIDERRKLPGREKRRRATAEIYEPKRPSTHHRLLAHQFNFMFQRPAIEIDIVRVLVRIDAEVAKLAPLPAKRNVQIKAQWHLTRWRRQRVFDLRQR